LEPLYSDSEGQGQTASHSETRREIFVSWDLAAAVFLSYHNRKHVCMYFVEDMVGVVAWSVSEW